MSNIAKRPKRKKKKKDQQKPQYNFIKKILITITLAVIFYLIFKITVFTFSHSKVLGISHNLNSAQIIALINEKRAQENLPALKPNEELGRAAQAKISDMFVYEYWDHTSPSNKTPWPFILDAGYDYEFAGENLAKDFIDNKTLVDAWMESDSHRANIMSSDFEDTAIIFGSGTIKGKETILIVQLFGKQYTNQDYLNAGVDPPRQFSSLSESLVSSDANRITWTRLFVSLIDFRILGFFIFGFLLGFALFELLSQSRKKKVAIMSLEKLKKKYWGKI